MKIFDVRTVRVEDAVEEAARIVFAGGTLVYPDETGYVLACDPLRESAMAIVRSSAAGREEREVTICVASGAELLEFVSENAVAAFAIKRLLNEPVAFIVRSPRFFADSAKRGVVVFRVPADPVARALLERCGPLIACATAYSGSDLDGAPHVDVLLERGEISPRLETSVVDVSGDHPRLVFEGSAAFDRLAARFGAAEFTR